MSKTYLPLLISNHKKLFYFHHCYELLACIEIFSTVLSPLLWSLIKNKLRLKDCTTVNKLIEAIILVWYHDDEIAKSCQKLVNSMPKRMKEVSKNKEVIYHIKCKNCFVF